VPLGRRGRTRDRNGREMRERIGSEADIKPWVHVRKQFGYCPNKSTLFLMNAGNLRPQR